MSSKISMEIKATLSTKVKKKIRREIWRFFLKKNGENQSKEGKEIKEVRNYFLIFFFLITTASSSLPDLITQVLIVILP